EIAFEEVPATPEQQRYVTETMRAILDHQPELDAIIGELAHGWRLERLANVDKNVLRIALYELLHHPELPSNQVVNEAVELAKKPTPARTAATSGPPRRRSPLDYVPGTAEPRFRVLGTGADRQALLTYANPMEMLVVHGFTREIEEAYLKFNGRIEDFWANRP